MAGIVGAGHGGGAQGVKMAYSAMAVANAFIRRALEGKLDKLTPMKLQKMMFYAQSWHLALKKEPLIDDFFCRWQYGPVIPSLYHEFKEYGAQPISAYGGYVVEDEGELLSKRPIVGSHDADTWELIDKMIEVYGAYSGAQLSALTHEPGTAWSAGPADGGPIVNELLSTCILAPQGMAA